MASRKGVLRFIGEFGAISGLTTAAWLGMQGREAKAIDEPAPPVAATVGKHALDHLALIPPLRNISNEAPSNPHTVSLLLTDIEIISAAAIFAISRDKSH